MYLYNSLNNFFLLLTQRDEAVRKLLDRRQKKISISALKVIRKNKTYCF